VKQRLRCFAKAALGLRGLRTDPVLAARYIALDELPAGTFGRAYFHHCRDQFSG